MRLLGLFLALTCVIVILGTATLALLPHQPQRVAQAEGFENVQTGPLRLPINLPQPAAGQVVAKITLNGARPKTENDAQPDEPVQEPLEAPVAASVALPTPEDASQRPRAPLPRLLAARGLPIIGPKGLRPFDAYRSPLGEALGEEKARLAIVVTGVGLSSARSQAVFDQLPAEISIAVSPYAQDPQRWLDMALTGKRDALIMVPMEPNSFPSIDPGPDTLMRDAPQVQTMERLHTVLASGRGYVGVINDTGSRFTANAVALAPVLDDLKTRGLMIVDARASAYSVFAAEAAKRDIPVAINTRFIDASLSPQDIQRQLRDLERTAQTLGVAVGIIRNLPISIEETARWAASLDKEEFTLAPISAVANRQPVR